MTIEAKDIRIPSPFHLKSGKYGDCWHGDIHGIHACPIDLFTEEDVEEVVYYYDSGEDWDGDGACLLRLKDGRLAAWECWWGPTGDSFSEDAYGGDGIIWLAYQHDFNTLVLQAFSDQTRRRLEIPVEGFSA